MNIALRIIDVLLAGAGTLAYTWVMAKKENHRSYAGPAQFWRYLGLWSILVSVAAGMLHAISLHRPLSYATWMITLALAVNLYAAYLTIRDALAGWEQIQARREDQ